jgi:hypothetical protein
MKFLQLFFPRDGIFFYLAFMMKPRMVVFCLLIFQGMFLPGVSFSQVIRLDTLAYRVYPEVNAIRPALPSPFWGNDGKEYVVAVNRHGQYAIIPVTPGNDREMLNQRVVDTADFPELAETGLHSQKRLQATRTITGRSVGEINRLAQPGGLSQGGFLAQGEDLLSVLKSDNQMVRRMGLTHPELARPLFHVLYMMDEDLRLNRWNMARHRWENITSFYYRGKEVFVEAEDTKGGQKSIFEDGIEGGFHIRIRRPPDEQEQAYLQEHYGHLPVDTFNQMKKLLTSLHTGEMQPQYIMRYGFYEGHTYWRTDPVTLAFIFGLKRLSEIDSTCHNNLYGWLTSHR